MTPMFPPELIERFVLELAGQGERVSPLLFVSRSACHAARRVIFQRIKLHYQPPATSLWVTRRFSTERLLDTLQGNEQLLGLIQEVTIKLQAGVGGHFTDPTPEDYFCDDEDYEGSDTESGDEHEPCPDPAFAPLLRLLSKCPINTLTLCSMAVGRQYRHFNMADFPPSIMGHLLTLRCLPTLRYLTLDNLAGMPALLVTGSPSTDRVKYLNLARYPMYVRQGARTLAPFKKDVSALPLCLSGVMADKTSVPFQSLEELEMSDPGSFPLFICRTIPEAFALDDKLAKAIANEEDANDDFDDSEFEDPSKNFTFPSLKTFRTGVRNINSQDVLVVATVLEHAPNMDTMVVEDNLLAKESTATDRLMACALVGLSRTSGTIRSLRVKHLGKPSSTRNFGEIKAISSLIGSFEIGRAAPASKNVIETITIEVGWIGVDSVADEKSLRRICSMKNGWRDLKKSLESFPKLQNLVLNLSVVECGYPPPRDDNRRNFEDLVGVLAAELSLGGKVKVDYSLSMREVEAGEFGDEPYSDY